MSRYMASDAGDSNQTPSSVINDAPCFSSFRFNEGLIQAKEKLERNIHTLSSKQHEILRLLSNRIVHKSLLDLNMRFSRIPIKGFPTLYIQIIHSDWLFTHAGPVLFVLQAGGVSRAGVWASRLLVRADHCLVSRSQRQLVENAHAAGFAVAIINANEMIDASLELSAPPVCYRTQNSLDSESCSGGQPPLNVTFSSNASQIKIAFAPLAEPHQEQLIPEGPSSSQVENATLPEGCFECSDDGDFVPIRIPCEDFTTSTSTQLQSASTIEMAESDCYAHHEEISLEERIYCVWEKLLPLCSSDQIFVWAHQYGASCFFYPLRPFPSFQQTRGSSQPSESKRSRTKSSLPESSPGDVTPSCLAAIPPFAPTASFCKFAFSSLSREVDDHFLTTKAPKSNGDEHHSEKKNLRSVRRRHVSATAVLSSVHSDVPRESAFHNTLSEREYQPNSTNDKRQSPSYSSTTNPITSVRKPKIIQSPIESNSPSDLISSIRSHHSPSTSTKKRDADIDRQLRSAWHRRAVQYWADIRTRVRGLVLTDAAIAANLPLQMVGWGLLKSDTCSWLCGSRLPSEVSEVRSWFRSNAIHYVTADAALGTRIEFNVHQFTGIPTISSGTKEHEIIPNAVTNAALDFFRSRVMPSPSGSINATRLCDSYMETTSNLECISKEETVSENKDLLHSPIVNNSVS